MRVSEFPRIQVSGNSLFCIKRWRSKGMAAALVL
jgi:hypothetical protein